MKFSRKVMRDKYRYDDFDKIFEANLISFLHGSMNPEEARPF